ncbi:DUF2971 domain-containing protein [Thalassotalea litorea]|uniref:DUF2971 domain-containing protein n=1 Tax=Thalassotalea litorea TaxID=2020715 RepID=UPI003736D44E
MKLYHFLNSQYALEAIKKQRLKVSKYSDFNDPFELTAVSLKDEQHRGLAAVLYEVVDSDFRALCFCSSWNNPIMWAHYADKHKGAVLEVEVAEHGVLEVTYSEERLEPTFQKMYEERHLESSKWDLINLCNTKYEGWKYEEEYRAIVEEKDIVRDKGIEFLTADTNFKITGIITGVRCELSDEQIESHIPNGQSIKVTRTQQAFDSFNIVENSELIPYQLSSLPIASEL